MKTQIKQICKLSLVLIGLMIINSVLCQNTDNDSVKEKEFSILNLLPQQLGLSPVQKEKIQLIYANHFLIKENNNKGFSSIWISDQSTESFEEKILEVLTDSQQQILRRYLSSSANIKSIKYSIKR